MMSEKRYEVLDGNTVIGTYMTLDNALLLASAYLEKYYNEPLLAVTIRKLDENCAEESK